MNLHIDKDKYGAMAAKLVDAGFKKQLENAISNKDLKQTLTLCATKATSVQVQTGFSNDEIAELAFEIFLVIFDNINMPDDKRALMAKTVLNKLREGLAGSKSPNSAPSPTASPKPPVMPPDPSGPSAPPIRPTISSSFPPAQPSNPFGSTSAPSTSSTISAPPSRPKVFSSTPSSMASSPSVPPAHLSDSSSNPPSSPLPATGDSKDLVIANLRSQLEEYKKKFQEKTYENLTEKIKELENKINQKNKEIEDLKANLSTSNGGGDINELRTKILLLQSKVRTAEGKVDELQRQNEELQAKSKRADQDGANSEQLEALKRQLRQEMETTDKLRNQINTMQTGMSSQAQAEIQSLRQQLQAAKMQGGRVNPQEVTQLRNEIAERDRKIAELERQVTSNSPQSTGPMGNLRMQREISALKAQIEMLKKNEAEMKSKYDAAMRKSQGQVEDDW